MLKAISPRIFRITFLIAAASMLSSCIYYAGPGGWRDGNSGAIRGSGRTVTEVRPVSGIRRVRLDNQGDLVITVGDNESLVVEADDNLMPYIRTEVRGGELRIENDGAGYFRNTRGIRYYLTVKSLEGMEAGSTGSISAPDITADDFDIRIRSTGDINMGSLEAENVDIEIGSTGDVMLHRLDAGRLDVRISSTGHVGVRNGAVDVQNIRITSTGSYEATDLASQYAVVNLHSTGSAYLNVDEFLDARLTSTGSLHYYGNPRTDIRRSSTGRALQISRR